MDVTIEVKEVYGRQMLYPVNEQARLFATLTGKKTFSKHDLMRVEKLGFKIRARVFGDRYLDINAEAL